MCNDFRSHEGAQGSFEEAKGLFYIGYYQSSVHQQNDA